jgi:hypothetical protein
MWEIGQKVICINVGGFYKEGLRLDEKYIIRDVSSCCGGYVVDIGLRTLPCTCCVKCHKDYHSFFINAKFFALAEQSYSGNAISEILEKFKPLEKETEIEVKELINN